MTPTGSATLSSTAPRRDAVGEASPVVPATPDRPARLISLDAYRGFVMLAMVSAGFGFARVADSFPDSRVWHFLGYQFSHVPWEGCAFWDLIQPSFMFMVGVAMPYSFASRKARGHSSLRNAAHVGYRSLVLILLGIFLVSSGMRHPNFTLVNVLTQIGLGYPFVYLLLERGWRVQLGTAGLILAGYWLFFALAPVPGPAFDYTTLGVKDPSLMYTGFFAHWNMNTNPAAVLDRSLLNALRDGWVWVVQPSQTPEAFRFSEGGYTTLNFIPSMATMIFGLITGEWMRTSRSSGMKLIGLLIAGVAFLAVGWALGMTVCPLVKRIWTPSWTIFSTGWTLLMLAAFFWLIDMRGWRKWAFPLVVVGMNSIAMYCMAQLMKGWVRGTFRTYLGPDVFGGTYGPILESVAILLVLWLICLWLYQRKIFLRI